MTPFKKCPACHSDFKQITRNHMWHEEYCTNDNCPIKLHQYYPYSFQDDILKYCSFYLKEFLIYAYFKGDNLFPEKQIHIYLVGGPSPQSPFIKFNHSNIDFDNLDALYQKLKTYLVFS